MTFTAKLELLSDILKELEPVFEEHWLELARNKDSIGLDPDYDRYLAMEKSGLYRLYVVRNEAGELAGYAGFIVANHLHYKDHKWALADLFYVRPKFRSVRKLGLGWKNRPKGAGTVLFDAAEGDLRQLGVSVLHVTWKLAVPMAGKMFSRRGYAVIEAGAAKVLK